MQKQQVFYIHGGESFEKHEDFLDRLKTASLWHLPEQSAFGNGKKWTATLAEDLCEDYEVIMPPMPNKQNAKFIEWKIWFERHFEFLNENVILIGCSLGAMFLAKYFSEGEMPFKPKVIILMAGAYRLPGFSDKDCGEFLVEPDKASPIKDKASKIVIIHSKDDPVVPYEHGETLAKAIPEAEFITFDNKNHFLIEDFSELLAKIRLFAKTQ